MLVQPESIPNAKHNRDWRETIKVNTGSVAPVGHKTEGLNARPRVMGESLCAHPTSSATTNPVRAGSDKRIRWKTTQGGKRGVMHDIKHFMNWGDRANTGAHPAPFRCDVGIKEMETFADRCALTTQDFIISPEGVIREGQASSQNGLWVDIKTHKNSKELKGTNRLDVDRANTKGTTWETRRNYEFAFV